LFSTISYLNGITEQFLFPLVSKLFNSHS
jgi:hypothetical protein